MKRILLLDREMSIALKSYAKGYCRTNCDTQKILKNVLAYSIQRNERVNECRKEKVQVAINIAVTAAGQTSEKPMHIIGSTMEEPCSIKVKITVA